VRGRPGPGCTDREREFLHTLEQEELFRFPEKRGSIFPRGREYRSRETEICGYIGAYGIPDEGDITNVSVQKEYRRAGIGRLLVDELIRRTLAAGITRIFLEVRESNAPAIHLYENAGFVRTGLRKNYYTSPVENAIIMMRDALLA
jgi:ribosomal-protein-alanine N-acetyltransferase